MGKTILCKIKENLPRCHISMVERSQNGLALALLADGAEKFKLNSISV